MKKRIYLPAQEGSYGNTMDDDVKFPECVYSYFYGYDDDDAEYEIIHQPTDEYYDYLNNGRPESERQRWDCVDWDEYFDADHYKVYERETGKYIGDQDTVELICK